MKLKYYGIGIGLIIAISCITLTFINLNTSNNKIENKSEVVATSSEQVYSPNNKQNIDDEKIQPSTKSNDSTVLELEPSTELLPIPDTKDVGGVEELPTPNPNSSIVINDLS